MPPKKGIKKEVELQKETTSSEGLGYQALRAVNKFVLYGGLSVFLFSLFLVDVSTFAAPNLSGELLKAGGEAHLVQQNIGIIIANIIQTVLGMLGVVFVILIIYSGFLWMTAGGESEKIKMAQAHIRNAIIGVVIVVGAQIITYWVLYQVTTAALRGQPELPATSSVEEDSGPPGRGDESLSSPDESAPETDPAAVAEAARIKKLIDAASAGDCGSKAKLSFTPSKPISDCSISCKATAASYDKGSAAKIGRDIAYCCCWN